jgi:lipooligosaccharide transport system permease protein
MKFALKSLFTFPELGPGVFAVWKRNFLRFRKTIWTSLGWSFFEPVLYLLAIGYGLGGLVEEVNGRPYPEFYAPALMAVNAMMVSFFEGTYGSYMRLEPQKTFDMIILTPVSASEVGVAEILWAASKGLLSTTAVAIVAGSFGVIGGPGLFPAFLVLCLICWVFAAFGVLMSSYAKNYDFFIYAQSGFIVPMSLFSGTFFPLSQLPDMFERFAWVLPLTHGVVAIRAVLDLDWSPELLLHIGVLLGIAILLTNWATAKLRSRILT